MNKITSSSKSVAPIRPNHDAERTVRELLIARFFDDLRFRGWFFCISELTAPWSLQLPGGRLSALHVVLEGECVLGILGDSDQTLTLKVGDIGLLPRDDIHIVADQPGRKAVPVAEIPEIDRRDRNTTSFRYGGGGKRTLLLTASFVAEYGAPEAMLAGLPALVVLHAASKACLPIEPVLQLIRSEASLKSDTSAAVLRRSAEILFVQVLREVLQTTRVESGWIAAASDPRLASVLAVMHAHPDRNWTLAELSERVHLSRSAFFERFTACMGITPKEYLGDLRLKLAIRSLRDTTSSVARIAMSIGYDSPSAFARAFRRATGQSPNQFRDQCQYKN